MKTKILINQETGKCSLETNNPYDLNNPSFIKASEISKLDLLKHGLKPYFDPESLHHDYYDSPTHDQDYWGLEYMPELDSYDLFSWGDLSPAQTKQINQFQAHTTMVLGFTPILNNY